MADNTHADENQALIDENKKLLDEVGALRRELKKSERELRINKSFLDKVTKASDAKDALNVSLSDANIKQRAYTDMLLQSCPCIIILFDGSGRFVLSTQVLMSEIKVPNFDYIKNREYKDVFPSYFTDESMEAFIGAFDKITATGEVVRFSAHIDFALCGQTRLYSVELGPAGLGKSDKTMSGVLAIMVDLTDLMREKQRVEDANRAKSDFLANMSHEVRTPMNAIMGMSEMLARSDLTERQDKYVSDIRKASAALLVIVNDILDFSKIEAGKMELIRTNFHLKMLLDNLRSMFTIFCRDKQLDIDFVIDGNLPDLISCDEIRLRQILTNLLSNAVKYTNHGGISLKAWLEGDDLRFDIVDTGIGIREEDQDRLFLPFEQLDTRRNKNTIGTGLGLSITYNLCTLMGGALWLESKYGEGSTFHIRIPYVGADAGVVDDIAETVQFKAPEARILIVDDIEINLAVAEALLSVFRIFPDLAKSGKDAIELAEINKYDIIFMDHMMPEMDGIETTGKIRSLGGWNETVPIVALTANAIAGMERFFLENRLDDFLPKPVDISSLNHCLKKWLPPGMIIDK